MTPPPIWPQPPQPGQPVRLPVNAPPVLLDALEYRGDHRYVAIYHDHTGVLRLDDGASRDEADTISWRHYTRHPLTQRILANYDLGDTNHTAQHWLLIDQHTNHLSITLPEDATALLTDQPHTRSPLTGNILPTRQPQPGTAQPHVATARTAAGSWREDFDRVSVLHTNLDHYLNRETVLMLLTDIHDLAEHIHHHTPPTPQPTHRPTDTTIGATSAQRSSQFTDVGTIEPDTTGVELA